MIPGGASDRAFTRGLALAAVGLALLLAVFEPGPTRHLGFPLALLHWLLHVGIGLLIATAVARGLLAFRAGWRPLPLVLVSGTLAAWLFAPLAVGLEALFPAAPAALETDWLDRLEARGGASRVAAEALQLWPEFLLAWVVINLPPVLLAPAGGRGPATQASPGDDPEPRARPGEGGAARSLLERLPPALGRDLVSLSADLHYLHVHTREGRTMLMGSLAEAEAALGERGIRIHRSHWVALAHVRRVQPSANGWVCELSDGRRLPVSRRRLGEVRRVLGTGFVRAPG